jgi:hypothetical protein
METLHHPLACASARSQILQPLNCRPQSRSLPGMLALRFISKASCPAKAGWKQRLQPHSKRNLRRLVAWPGSVLDCGQVLFLKYSSDGQCASIAVKSCLLLIGHDACMSLHVCARYSSTCITLLCAYLNHHRAPIPARAGDCTSMVAFSFTM